jgi:hypothetical protein
VGIGPAQIGLYHQAGDRLGIAGRQPGRLEGALDERRQGRGLDARPIACTG